MSHDPEMIVESKRVTYAEFAHHNETETIGKGEILVAVSEKIKQNFSRDGISLVQMPVMLDA